jgi:outer membrane immunogenic protein
MKRVMIAGALALAAGSQAFAADLPPPIAPPPRAPATYVPAMAPAYNWSGFYLGINGGYGVGSSDWTGGVVSSGNFDTSGFLIGGTAGANYQIGQFVFGAETDLDFSTIKGNGPAGFCINCETTNNWLGTARGRAGFALDRVLFYATGGAAYGNIDASANGTLNKSTEVGWTAGAGVEGAFADNWTAKLEYLYADLGHGSCTTACGTALGFATQSVSLKENLIRLGVNYKFGY